MAACLSMSRFDVTVSFINFSYTLAMSKDARELTLTYCLTYFLYNYQTDNRSHWATFVPVLIMR